MGYRNENMKKAWDNIPPAADAVASSTYVDKVMEPKANIDEALLKKLSSSIKKTDQDKYDKAMSDFNGIGAIKNEAIERGRLTPNMLDMSDEDLTTALINRDYNQK